MRRVPLGCVVLVLLTLTGCELPEDDWGIVRVVWNTFPWGSVLWRVALWTFLGVIAGLFIGVVITLLLRRWGAYRLPWPRVGFWLRIVIFALNVIAMPILFGTIGFLDGVFRGSEVGLRRSVIGTEWLPQLGAVGADAFVVLDGFADKEDFIDWDEARKQSLNVPRFLKRLDRLKAGAAEKITAQAKDKLFTDNPEWKGGFAETVIDWTLPYILSYLINRQLNSRLKEHGVHDFLGEMRVEAQKDGDDLLTHEELAQFLSDRVLIPMILYPVRKWVVSTQWTTLAIAAGWFATPVVLMWITRWINFWWKRRQIRRMCPDSL